MSRIIKGTQDAKGRVFMKQAEGGMGRIRCPRCQALAVDAIDTRTGQQVKRCGGCGQQFTIVAMGGKNPARTASTAAPAPAQQPSGRPPGSRVLGRA